MRSVIHQSVVLAAPGDELFDTYLDPARHAAVTGGPVTIGPKPGDAFAAFDGQLSGQILAVVRPRLIVQSWRSVNFKDDDPDSTLILSFSEKGTAGRIDLIHVDVPEHDYDGVTEGWQKYYWQPWNEHLGKD